jgi:amino acid transporter
VELKRDLGLYAVIAVSLGAMVGSGLFVLPGLAVSIAGPAVVAAYLLAGFVVFPAALSKSEMATAMPHAGGTYLYIDRAMGPLMGTIAGFGVWFSLVFKAAFALVGLGAYLQLVVPDAPTKTIGLVLAGALIVVNGLGVKQTGSFQAIVVSVVMASLIGFVAFGLGDVDVDRFDPVAPKGLIGLLSATGLVFVSYAGVTKIASIAEEIEHPARNIPRAILTSLILMMVVYPAVVFVIVGATPRTSLSGSATPVAEAALAFGGEAAEIVFGLVAVLALVSMANAGVLASSRYPFAMARNGLAPAIFGRISARATPLPAVVLTGALLMTMIAVFPILDLAKLASAFQLLVFSLVNVAVLAFRESHVDWYRPPFRSPLYPWTQILGIAAALVLLGFMGTVPIVGAAAIVLGGVVWYRIFGRSRASHESAGLDALRNQAMTRLVAESEAALAGPGKHHTVIAVSPETSERRIHDLLRTAGAVSAPRQPALVVCVNRDGPDGGLRRAVSSEEQGFDRRVAELGARADVPLTVQHASGKERRAALDAYVRDHGVDLILTELDPGDHPRGFGADMEWLGDHAMCDFAFLGNRYLDAIDDIAVLGSGGPLDAIKVNLAGRIASVEKASIRFVHVLEDHASGRQVVSLRDYHRALDGLVEAPTVSEVLKSEEFVVTLSGRARRADLVIMGALRTRYRILTDLVDRIRHPTLGSRSGDGAPPALTAFCVLPNALRIDRSAIDAGGSVCLGCRRSGARPGARIPGAGVTGRMLFHADQSLDRAAFGSVDNESGWTGRGCSGGSRDSGSLRS